jgi:hypothetical protein
VRTEERGVKSPRLYNGLVRGRPKERARSRYYLWSSGRPDIIAMSRMGEVCHQVSEPLRMSAVSLGNLVGLGGRGVGELG